MKRTPSECAFTLAVPNRVHCCESYICACSGAAQQNSDHNSFQRHRAVLGKEKAAIYKMRQTWIRLLCEEFRRINHGQAVPNPSFRPQFRNGVNNSTNILCREDFWNRKVFGTRQ